jgi:hypothetical protein
MNRNELKATMPIPREDLRTAMMELDNVLVDDSHQEAYKEFTRILGVEARRGFDPSYGKLVARWMDSLFHAARRTGRPCDFQVLGVLIVKTGAPMPDHVRGCVLKALRRDRRARMGDADRRELLNRVSAVIESHPAEGIKAEARAV